MGVNSSGKKKVGAGDQGMMSGYATNETPELMPAPIMFANKLAKQLADIRKSGFLNYLRPDGKTQVTVEYDNHRVKRLDSIVVAAQHNPDVSLKTLREDIKEYIIAPICEGFTDSKTNYFVNNTGRFVIGGPVADSGCTGRKIIADTYGGMGNHGGGAFSGKDPTKVDRTAAYYARYMAKNIVASGLAGRCEIQLAYVIGGAKPLSVFVDTYGTGRIPDEKLVSLIKKEFDLTPAGMIEALDLRRPIYRKTTCYGHFGRTDPDFTWEKTDIAHTLANDL
ncbi:MAG: methionine adenosyltransferase, partial [archaeon]